METIQGIYVIFLLFSIENDPLNWIFCWFEYLMHSIIPYFSFHLKSCSRVHFFHHIVWLIRRTFWGWDIHRVQSFAVKWLKSRDFNVPTKKDVFSNVECIDWFKVNSKGQSISINWWIVTLSKERIKSTIICLLYEENGMSTCMHAFE